MKENPRIEQFNSLMSKYNMTDPLPQEVKLHILLNKKRLFKKTLKRTVGYSAVFLAVAGVFFTLKKYGIGITIVKSAIFLGAAAFFSAGAVSAIVYLFAVQKTPDTHAIQEILDKAITQAMLYNSKLDDTDKEEGPIESAAVIEDRIGVQVFNAIDLPSSMAVNISDRISLNLAKMRGEIRVVNLRLGRKGKKSGMMLFGTLEAEGDVYSITVKVVNIKDSKILFYENEKALNDQDIDGACERLSKRIFDRIK
jgi:hypothetical protein